MAVEGQTDANSVEAAMLSGTVDRSVIFHPALGKNSAADVVSKNSCFNPLLMLHVSASVTNFLPTPKLLNSTLTAKDLNSPYSPYNSTATTPISFSPAKATRKILCPVHKSLSEGCFLSAVLKSLQHLLRAQLCM